MENNQGLKNVIQFPGMKKDNTPEPSSSNDQAKKTPKAKKTNPKPATVGSTVIAILVASFAVNQFVFTSRTESQDQSSVSRSIASVSPMKWNRDADSERTLSQALAVKSNRSIASVHIGRTATKEEKLKWGVLNDKYTINWRSDSQGIAAITLQDTDTDPSYILDRPAFLKEYGTLFKSSFATARLKSVEMVQDNIVEAYTLIDDSRQPSAEVKFVLDRHKRLISLKVEPDAS